MASPPGLITTRPVLEADVPLVHALACRIWRAYYPAVIPPEQIEYMLKCMYAPEVIRRELIAGIAWELILREEEAVGYLSFSHDLEAGLVQLKKLYVLPALHGLGLGQQVLARVKAQAAAAGAKRVRLTVNKRNVRAIRAYERAGFRIAEASVTDIGNGFVMDDYIMVCDLSAPPGPTLRFKGTKREEHRLQKLRWGARADGRLCRSMNAVRGRIVLRLTTELEQQVQVCLQALHQASMRRFRRDRA
jgi:ribosomal protein S18 acetylase RimI-like enzyme